MKVEICAIEIRKNTKSLYAEEKLETIARAKRCLKFYISIIFHIRGGKIFCLNLT